MSTNRRQFLSGAVGGIVAAGVAGRTRQAWAQGTAPRSSRAAATCSSWWTSRTTSSRAGPWR